jgi:hypothetical protein
MTTELTETLDAALEQLLAGEATPGILAQHPNQAEALAPLLDAAASLEVIQPVEMPAAESMAADRDDFLAQFGDLGQQPVSPGPLLRLREWIAHHVPRQFPDLTLQQKEQRRMSALLVKATLIISMAFGSAGGAAALAANSLPDSPLYSAKLAMEQTRLHATSDPAEQAALHMVLAGVRAQEMERLALAGDVPDEATTLRLQMHLNQAFQVAAGLPDDDMLGFLAQARQTIESQEQALEQVQSRVSEPAQEPLRQARQVLNRARQDVETGLADPLTFRWRHAKNRPDEAPSQPTVVPAPGHNHNCASGDCEPAGDQHQYGPQSDQLGPGEPGGNPDCDGDCEPTGDQHQYGPQPDLPGPSEPGGNPDCDGDCEPVGDQHQYGPQPDQPGPGEPGGNPACPTDDCKPVGDQHQHGPQPDLPGPGEPGGNPDCDGDCELVGDEHHNGPGPSQPTEDGDKGTMPPADQDGDHNHGDDNGGGDDDQDNGDNGGENGGKDDGDDGGHGDNGGGGDNGGSGKKH